ncbi:MAG: phenylpropionate dioxygenase-like ring-hydroxylating dioxygenase large terminal subunit [Candidatus Azotimanducaceae bacterium]|jgi:phenylpropionate dioxygenase-like ring-hydroxylating dioxygenase large terminal subunit
MGNDQFDIYAASDQNLSPGEARCPGPSTQETLTLDSDNPPAALKESRYVYLGSDDIRLSRYTDETFYQTEIKNVWQKTWQWACREEHVPNPGDYHVYDICDDSIFVVRGEDQKLRAFINSCPHRGMQFFDTGEQGKGKQFLRCPFHGMSWHLDGALRDIPCRWDFPHIDDADFGLTEIPCDNWGGFVFINLDAGAQPLKDYLQVLPEHFAEWPLEDRFISLHTQKILPGNWKMCMEAFLEAFHVLATHPEALRTSSWANTQYDIFSPHVTRFLQNLSSGNPHFEKSYTEKALFEFFGHDSSELPEGQSARQAHADILRKNMSESLSVDLSRYSNSEMLDSIEYHLFPNACFFPGIVIPLIYRFRPLGVDRCIHDVMLLQPLPDKGPRPSPAPVEYLDIDEPYTSLDTFNRTGLSHVLDQDSDNFKRQWAGIKASKKGRQTLGNYQEVRIRHFHAVLDTYLYAGNKAAID